MKEGVKVVATNRKAYHDYFIEETYEAGIVLTGTEIKSVRASRVNLKDGYVTFRDGEAWLVNVHISPYEHRGYAGHDPTRDRKLLLHKKEIDRLQGRVQEKGWTVVPLRMYLKDGRAKVEIALVRGKKKYDKRQAIARREHEREIRRAFKEWNR